MTFPDDAALCERCGYPLRGLSALAGSVCPECGQAVTASDPVHRVGLPWQRRPSLRTFFSTLVKVAIRPGVSYRAMRVGDDPAARLFLLLHVLMIAAGWSAGVVARGGGPGRAALIAFAVAVAVVLLTYIEAAGVTYFSSRHGWRVPFRLAEQIACYAAPGWLPAAAIFGVVLIVDLPAGLTAYLDPTGMLIVYVSLLGVSMLGFETLVWLGVRQCRFANQGSP